MEIALNKEIVSSKIFSRIIGIAVFVILTALGAFVRIPLPFTPVPLTLQTFFVLLSGVVLGSRLGLLSQSFYLFLGLAGVPLFSGAGSGLPYLLGPTGGYIFGFLLAANFASRARELKDKSFIQIFLFLVFADLLLLLCGTIWLKAYFPGYGPARLFLIGTLPFLPGDLIKASFAAFIYLKIEKRVKEIF